MGNFKLLGRNGKMAARVFNFQKYKPLPVLQEQASVQIVMGGIGGGLMGAQAPTMRCYCNNPYVPTFDSNTNTLRCYYSQLGLWQDC